ncbi:MAG: diacylglycerol kinase family protein [Chthoniobacteraceae bacterium]
MQDIAIIFNPKARSEKSGGLAEELRRLAPDAALRMTEQAGDARRLAAEAAGQGFRVVVAAGGDGTVNEVANGLAGTGVALGVLPVGTMNVFAKEHDLPERMDHAWEVIRDGRTRAIDLLAANSQHFLQLAGVGLDAQVVKETTWESKMNLGPLSYLINAAHIAARTPPRLVIEAGGATTEGSLVLIGNGRFYGAKLVLFPKAKADDGLLDVLVFKNLGYLDIARYLTGVLIGRHTGMDDVEYFQVAEARVRSSEEVPVEVDGELSGTLPVTFRVAGKLTICVP